MDRTALLAREALLFLNSSFPSDNPDFGAMKESFLETIHHLEELLRKLADEKY